MLSENNSGQPPSQQNLQQWEQQYGMSSIPVLGLTSQDTDEWSDLAYIYEADLYIPTMYHLGPDMTVLGADTGSSDPGRYF